MNTAEQLHQLGGANLSQHPAITKAEILQSLLDMLSIYGKAKEEGTTSLALLLLMLMD